MTTWLSTCSCADLRRSARTATSRSAWISMHARDVPHRHRRADHLADRAAHGRRHQEELHDVPVGQHHPHLERSPLLVAQRPHVGEFVAAERGSVAVWNRRLSRLRSRAAKPRSDSGKRRIGRGTLVREDQVVVVVEHQQTVGEAAHDRGQLLGASHLASHRRLERFPQTDGLSDVGGTEQDV